MDYEISEISRLFGMSQSGIRFYEEKGLISPGRTEGGRRKYDEKDLLALMYLRKIHSMEISLEETREFFHYGNTHMPEETAALMAMRVQATRNKAAYYDMLADTLERNAGILRDPQAHIGKWKKEITPAFYCLVSNPLFGKGKTEQQAIAEWITIVPLNQTLTVVDIQGNAVLRRFFGFGVNAGYADKLELPLRDKAIRLPKVTAMRTIVETVGMKAYELPMQRILELYREVDGKMNWGHARIVSNFFHVYQSESGMHKLYMVWISEIPE